MSCTTGVIKLYSYHKSSCSWRLRILLNLKKISYEYKAVVLSSKDDAQQKSADFTAINPSAQVPVLFIDGMYLSESVAIAEYLEETRPQPNMFPTGDPVARVRVRTMVEIINAGIQPKQNLSVISMLANEYTNNEDDKRRWAAYHNTRGLQCLENLMGQWSGKCCVGDEITFADCCLVPQVYSAQRFKVDVQQLFPNVWRVFSYLDKLPEFKAAHSEQQPDAPKVGT